MKRDLVGVGEENGGEGWGEWRMRARDEGEWRLLVEMVAVKRD